MNKKAFTLIELLVVVLIISTLASLSVPQYFKLLEKARFADVVNHFGTIKNSEERYYLKKGVYTNNFSELDVVIRDINGNPCQGLVCEIKHYYLYFKVSKDGQKYLIIAKRKNTKDSRPPQKYGNYIAYYYNKTQKMGCNQANCVRDFLDY